MTFGATSANAMDEQRALPVRDYVCSGCACLCDDISALDISLVDDTFASTKAPPTNRPLCELGREWLKRKPLSPNCFINGMAVQLLEAITAAAELVQQARLPLVHGGQRSSTAGVRQMLAFAEQSRGLLDSTDDIGAAWEVAYQSQGMSTATWGEIRDRADVLVYWQFPDVATLPRHLERYGFEHPGPGGLKRGERWVAVVGDDSELGRKSNAFFRLRADQALNALVVLRSLLQKQEPAPDLVQAATGIPLASWKELMARLCSAKYGALVVGPRLGTLEDMRPCSEVLLRLTRDLNATTRCVCVRETGRLNGVGSIQTPTWQSGFPCAIRFDRGYPQYDPWSSTAGRVLTESEPDLIVCVQSDLAAWSTPAIKEHLGRIPRIVIDDQADALFEGASVAIPVAIPGLETAADFFRSDGICIRTGDPLRATSELPSAEWVLSQLIAAARLNRDA